MRIRLKVKSKSIFYRNLILSGVSIFFGICMGYVYLNQENGGYPQKNLLSEKVGRVDWVYKYKYGIRFGLVDDERNYVYPSKSNGQGIVLDSLMKADSKNLSILFDAKDPKGPIYNDSEYYSVFEIVIDGKPIRMYEESEKAWKGDNNLMPFIALFFFIGGLYLWNKTKKDFAIQKI